MPFIGRVRINGDVRSRRLIGHRSQTGTFADAEKLPFGLDK